jgi:hypothetical protein
MHPAASGPPSRASIAVSISKELMYVLSKRLIVKYRLHTSCITEEEKYQGALYKPKKAKVEKVLAPVKVVAPVKVETAKKPTLIAQIEEKVGKVVEEPTKKEEAAPAKEIDGAEKQIRKVVKSTLKRLSSDAPMSLQALKKRIVDKVVEKNSELSEKKVGKQLEQIMMIKEVDGKITLEI